MRKMIFFAMTMLMAVSLNAQQSAGNRQQSMQRIEQQVRHYSEAFALSEEQAQQFDELYKAYSKQMRAILNQYKHERLAPGIQTSLVALCRSCRHPAFSGGISSDASVEFFAC